MLGDGGDRESDTEMDEDWLAKGWVVLESSCLGSKDTRARAVGTQVIGIRIGLQVPRLLGRWGG